MKKKKILIVHNYYQIPGGEDTVVDNEKQLLIKNGHEVILYTRHNNEIKSKKLIEKIILPFETMFSLKTYKEIKEVIQKERIDLVHVHNTLPLISPSVYYAANKMKVPVVQTIHNFRLICPGATLTNRNYICEKCIEKNLLFSIKNRCYRKSFFQTIVIALTLKFNRIIGSYKKVNKYIALTDFNKKKLSKVLDKKNICVKPNFQYKDIKVNKISEKKYFVFIGRLDKLKGINFLVETWTNISDKTLLIIGLGPEENAIKNYIYKNNIENIKVLGFKDSNEIINILKDSIAIIVPSQWYEGFPMTIIEALSCGVPIIGGNIGNVSQIVKHNYNGLLFQYNDKKDLIKNIKKLEDKELLKKLSEGAIEDYKINYNKEKNYEKLIEIYNEAFKSIE